MLHVADMPDVIDIADEQRIQLDEAMSKYIIHDPSKKCLAENAEQKFRQTVDMKLKQEDFGCYRGFYWTMNRPFGTFWAGFIYGLPSFTTDSFTTDSPDYYQICDHPNLNFIECQKFQSGVYRFHCAHKGDYVELFQYVCNGEYKDGEWVRSKIKRVIDHAINSGEYKGPSEPNHDGYAKRMKGILDRCPKAN